MQRIAIAALAVVLIAAMLWWRFQSNRAVEERGERAHAAALALCATCRDYVRHRPFFEEWSPDAHEIAFKAATEGGLLAQFDESTYQFRFLGYLAGKAQSSGMRDVAEDLRRLQREAAPDN